MGLASLNGHVLDDKYRIERELGRGGMGAVYRATHLGTDRPVALKVIAPQFMMNDEFVERFRREAKAAGRLHHPNVVNVTDFGFASVDDKQVAYLVMEYLDGCTLADILEEETTLPIGWTVDIIEQACSALDEAHRQGIVHRDLKPDNLWLEPNRRGGYRVKVLDFGLAKLDAPIVDEGSGSLQPHVPQTAIPGLPDGGSIDQVLRGNSLGGNSPGNDAGADSTDRAATLLLDPESGEHERDTRIIEVKATEVGAGPGQAAAAVQAKAHDSTPADSIADDQTRILDPDTVDDRSSLETVNVDGLTRVGSILGTPVYMSPEQCRAEPLDARSDIYSLGVIVYRMLAGEPPFRGTMAELMRQHVKTPPPPLRLKRRKIPKKLGELVMLALSKDPADRPQTAAGFASALRAYSEGTGALLRRAFALYSENFPKFIRLSLLVYFPLIVMSVLLLVTEILRRKGSISSTAGQIWAVVLGVVTMLGTLVASNITVGVMIRLVTQLNLAPLRPLRVRLALASLKKRFWPLLLTSLLVLIVSTFGLVLGVIPGVIFYIYSTLTAPVVVMENLKGWSARRRSKLLVKRVRWTALAVVLIQFSIPMFASAMGSVWLVTLLKADGAADRGVLVERINSVGTTTLHVFIVPLIASLTALLYLKARQAGGETLREVMSQFEEEDTPRTRWQMRMRERLSLPTQTGR